MSLPINRTAKSTLDTNLVNGNTSDAPAIKNSDDVVYNTIDELNAKVDGLVGSSALSPYPPSFLSRQSGINFNFDVWQRGTSFTNPASLSYTADRFMVYSFPDGGILPTTITHSRATVTPGVIPAAFNHYAVSFNGAGSAFGANSQYLIAQRIENGNRYLCGSGKKLTVSFWAYSTIAGKRLGVSAAQIYGTGGTPSAVEGLPGSYVTLVSGWQKYTVSILTNTLSGKTFGTNNDDFLEIDFQMMWGTSVSYLMGTTTAETFGGNGTVNIAQVQVNAGDQALPFQPRSLGEELILCQRYFQRGFQNRVVGTFYNSTTVSLNIPHIVPMRIGPTISKTGTNINIVDIGTGTLISSASPLTPITSQYASAVDVGGFTGANVFRMARMSSDDISLDAEL